MTSSSNTSNRFPDHFVGLFAGGYETPCQRKCRAGRKAAPVRAISAPPKEKRGEINSPRCPIPNSYE
jgi:hypothetical protein